MLSSVPVYSSNYLSPNKIFLDFDGHEVSDTYWTTPGQNAGFAGNSGNPIHAPVYNIPGDSDYDAQGIALPFSAVELEFIEMAWRVVAEDFAPFDVDVTTVEPPAGYFEGDGGRAIRVLFTSHFDDDRLNGTALGGNNWVGSDIRGGLSTLPDAPLAERAWNYNGDRPIWVFANEFDGFVAREHPDTGVDPPVYGSNVDPAQIGAWVITQEHIGGIASHELGHAFGLKHDGINIDDSTPDPNSPGQVVEVGDFYFADDAYDHNGDMIEDRIDYYGGHTDPGAATDAATSWGPIVGGAMLRNLTQWNTGAVPAQNYLGATHHGGGPNYQDDIAIIADRLRDPTDPMSTGFRADDHGGETATATLLTEAAGYFGGLGIIGGSTQTDNDLNGTFDDNDLDFFLFDAGPSPIDITIDVDPIVFKPNLDVGLRVYKKGTTNELIFDSRTYNGNGDSTPDFDVFLNASFTIAQATGEYYIEVDGVGKNESAVYFIETDNNNTVISVGYSDYGSLGQYSVDVRRHGSVPSLLGDYNQDLVVDGADYPVWRDALGEKAGFYYGADGSGNGVIDQADYLIWRAFYGAGTAPNLVVWDTAPQVTNVTISGSQSTHADYSFDTVDGTGAQLGTVPVGGADTISITFSEDVNVAAGDLSLVGLLTANAPSLAEFTYDAMTLTANWRFTGWALGDHYAMTLSDAVTDLEGYQLDGEWVNPQFLGQTNSAISEFPSGDGTAGGDFTFVMALLPGDANLDGVVGSDDVTILSGSFGIQTGAFFANADSNGDGAVSSTDITILLANWSVNLQNAIDILSDLDGDGDVDEFDEGDIDGDGDVDQADYDLYFAQFGLDVEVAV